MAGQSGQVQVSYQTGKTVYCLIRDNAGLIWSASGFLINIPFVPYSSADYIAYPRQLTEQGASAYYVGNFPQVVSTPGIYNIVAKQQLGGSPAESDPTVGTGQVDWDTNNILGLADLASSGQVAQSLPLRLARGVAVSGFPFKMVSAADHVTPLTSGTLSGQISRDGGAFGALQSGVFTEIGLGWYKCNFTSGDLLATTVALVFSAAGADQRDMAVILQRTSGQ